jgi:8-oxo-dGTP pyrophosphatase MutT (NUDIX family)
MPITPWKVLGSRYVVRDSWMTLRADRCEMVSGVTLDPYYVQEPPDWVHIVAFDDHDRVLIIRQYRHGAGVISNELPSGTVETGESPIDAARRELLEETGCAAETLLALPVLSPNPARYSNRIHAFLATGTRCVQEQTLDDTEEIEWEFLKIPEVLTLIDASVFPQALHVASLFIALRQLRQQTRVDNWNGIERLL